MESCYFEENWDLIVKENYWKCAEFLINMCLRSFEMRKVLFDACYINNDSKFDSVKKLIMVLVSGQKMECVFDSNLHEESLERTLLDHYSKKG